MRNKSVGGAGQALCFDSYQYYTNIFEYLIFDVLLIIKLLLT